MGPIKSLVYLYASVVELTFFEDMMPSSKNVKDKILLATAEYFNGSTTQTQRLYEAKISLNQYLIRLNKKIIKAIQTKDYETYSKLSIFVQFFEYLEHKVEEMPISETVALLQEIQNNTAQGEHNCEMMLNFLKNTFEEYSSALEESYS